MKSLFAKQFHCSIKFFIFTWSEHRHARRARVILFLLSVGDRSIHGAVCSNDLVNLTICDVKQERNWEFMMYMRCYISHGKIALVSHKMFDWANYSNLTGLQINVDTILFSNSNLIPSLIQPTQWLVWHAHMHNSLTHRSHSPSNPQEEFLLKNTQVK